MKPRILLISIFFFPLLLFLGGCSTPRGDQPLVAVILPHDEPHIQLAAAGFRQAAKEAGVAILLNFAGDSSEEETHLIDNAIWHKADVLIIMPISGEGSLPALRRVKAAEIPILCFGSCEDMTGIASAAYNLSDRDLGASSGNAALQTIVADLNSKAGVSLLNCASTQYCQPRRSGFLERMRWLPGIQIVSERSPEEGETAQAAVAEMLAEHPEIDLLWAGGEAETAGAVRAVQELGRVGEVAIIGTGMNEEIAGMLQADAGILLGSAVQPWYEAGVVVFYLAQELHAGRMIPEETSAKPIYLSREDPSLLEKYIEAEGKLILSGPLDPFGGSTPGAGEGSSDCGCEKNPAHPILPTPP